MTLFGKRKKKPLYLTKAHSAVTPRRAHQLVRKVDFNAKGRNLPFGKCIRQEGDGGRAEALRSEGLEAKKWSCEYETQDPFRKDPFLLSCRAFDRTFTKALPRLGPVYSPFSSGTAHRPWGCGVLITQEKPLFGFISTSDRFLACKGYFPS